jgi:L-lactate dehydrogenase
MKTEDTSKLAAGHASARRKVTVVGAGAVGSTFCYSLAQSGLAGEIVLIDQNRDLAKGQVLDLVHGQPYFPPVAIRTGEAADYAESQLIVVTAGAAQRPWETRLQMVAKNAAVMRAIAADIVAAAPEAVILVVSNPVDIMTQVMLETTGWDRSRVIGSGTVLDSARLRQKLGARFNVDVHNVHGYVLGEHGDSEFAAWSLTHVAGMPVETYHSLNGGGDWAKARDLIQQEVRDSAYHIIDYKGATWFAVGLALVRIAAAVLRGQSSILTISTLLRGEYGLENVCLSVPCRVSTGGIESIVAAPLPREELALLHASAATLAAVKRDLAG